MTEMKQDAAFAKDYLSAYKIDAVVFYGDPTRIYRARRRSNGTRVMLKTLRDESAAREAAVLLQHEFEVAKRLKVDSVVQVFSLERHNNLPVIELEDFGGDSLDNIARQRRLTAEELLKIAVQVTQGLADIHRANIIHKDINPSNIVYNPSTGVAKIIDFGISTYLTREQAALTSPEMFEGSLPYISPEQTGRMNRSIDYRTDFYSFGVTIYELLTGQPLFIVSEPIEWFHCHIAKQPVPPDEIDRDIPRPLSEIVLKLIAKTAEDRYQSAKGIQADLQHCLDELRRTGTIQPFALAGRDISERFQIPQRLYGREKELAQLMSNFERAAQGLCKMILVSGYSGIGKTCLIKEIYKPITERRGHFVSGKFEQLNRNVPYSAISAALRDLVRQLLTEPEEKLEQWRSRIRTAVGPNGQLIVDILRELELVIGPQPAVPDVSAVEAEQRFHLVFRRFIQIFCKTEHPLVIFLDDLQWVDSSSMRLLELLTSTESGITNLLVIGAYRDNEVPETHPVALWLKEMRTGDFPLDEIRLQPLFRKDLAAMLADTLGTDTQRVSPLAEIVAEKTAGNPFFAEEFLKTLNQERLIVFSAQKESWIWDIERIQAQQMTDNVVELMTAKLKQLPLQTRGLIELGACIGFRFSLNVLAVVSETTPAKVAKDLQEGIAAGLIAPIENAYQLFEPEQIADRAEITVELAFAHDRIHQAAYCLLKHDHRREAHLKIGRLLRDRLSSAQQEERLFEITNHLNWGVELISDPAERALLCRMNLAAGKRAKDANAYQTAFDHFQAAMLLLDDDAWQNDYPLALELHIKAAEAAYLSGDYKAMDDLVAMGFANAKDLLDTVEFYLVQISACMARGRLPEAIDVAKTVLARLGQRYPARPNKLHLIFKFIRLKRLLRGKRIEDLRNLPIMTDPKDLAAEKIGHQIGGAALFAQPLLLPLLVLNSVALSLKQGLNPTSSTTYPVFGMMLIETQGDVERGQSFGRLGLELVDRFSSKALEGRARHIYNAFVRHWKEPVRNTIAPLHEAFCICLENGDFEYAAHAISVRLIYAFETGMKLNTLFKEITAYIDIMKPLRQGPRIHYIEILLQELDNLLGNSDDPARLKGRFYDIDKMFPLHVQSNDKSLLATELTQQAFLFYHYRHYEMALDHLELIRTDGSNAFLGLYSLVPFYTLDSLVRLAVAANCGKKQRRRLLCHVKSNIARLKRWAKINPANALNKLRLVEAERLRVLGRWCDAHLLFDESIRLAREQGFLNEEALANELCGAMLVDVDRPTFSDSYLEKARDLYNLWGSRAKVKYLEERFPKLVQVARRKSDGTASRRATVQAGVDISSLIKALKVIAEETVHSRMVETIIVTALEFAGAQQGSLILRDPKGDLNIEAQACVDCEDVQILQSIPVTAGKLSQAVINYVSRTGSSIVVHDAQQDCEQIPGLNQDSHIQEEMVRSLLCLPILTGRQEESELIGMLYLENNRASGTFTQERFDILEIICLSAAGRLELSRKATVDGLTQLFNHDYFQNILSKEYSSARRHHHDLSLVLMDIDHFKRFNDTWGHQVGDQVLKEVAQVIKSACRTGDIVARYGGEEIVAILPMTSKKSAELVAERIRLAVEKHRVDHNDKKLQVTISLGMSFMDSSITDKDRLIRRADNALYRSKADGRNRLTIG